MRAYAYSVLARGANGRGKWGFARDSVLYSRAVGVKASTSDLDEVDAGWDADDEEEDEEDEIDAGWDDVEAGEGAPQMGAPSPRRSLTQEESDARVARAASRKERQRAKAVEKTEKRKARQSAANAKQKKARARNDAARAVSSPQRKRPESLGGRLEAPRRGEEAHEPSSRAAKGSSSSRSSLRLMAVLLTILAIGGGVAFLLLRR
jgi:cobalamin biosynthesis Mg chelatase CobN